MDEIIYLAKEIPGCNKYDAIEMDKLRSRSPNPNFNDRNKKEFNNRMEKLKKNDQPSVTSYQTHLSYEVT